MDILDDMGVSKLSAKVFLKVNYSFKEMYYFFLQVSQLSFSLNSLVGKRLCGTCGFVLDTSSLLNNSQEAHAHSGREGTEAAQ